MARALAILALRLYRRWISPSVGPACRYWPPCSSYAEEAIQRYGVFHGTWLVARRLFRCHPLGGHGVDPVP